MNKAKLCDSLIVLYTPLVPWVQIAIFASICAVMISALLSFKEITVALINIFMPTPELRQSIPQI
jgi:hypothetical protein